MAAHHTLGWWRRKLGITDEDILFTLAEVVVLEMLAETRRIDGLEELYGIRSYLGAHGRLDVAARRCRELADRLDPPRTVNSPGELREVA